MRPLVFVVDGLAERRSIVQYALEEAGYVVEAFATACALNVAGEQRPAAMVIATRLPDGNGIDLCCQVRRRPELSGTRVVLLADNKMSKYQAVLDSSADECVSVPLAPGEIASVISFVLARPHDVRSNKAGDILINSSAMRVAVRGKEISTTTLEFRLIQYMARHQGEAFTRDALLDAVWGDLQFVTPRSVDACIRRIRRKIEPNSSSPVFLKSVRGVGYKLDATPIWETSADCECAACSSARMRTKAGPIRQVGRILNNQDRPS
jgi:two-component system phosphate regulon response regulator PhoB